MDEVFKSKLSFYKNGLLTTRNDYKDSSYLLRSASKNNVSRKQGIYSKFLSKSKANLSSGYLTSQQHSENSQLHSSSNNERRGNLKEQINENFLRGKEKMSTIDLNEQENSLENLEVMSILSNQVKSSSSGYESGVTSNGNGTSSQDISRAAEVSGQSAGFSNANDVSRIQNGRKGVPRENYRNASSPWKGATSPPRRLQNSSPRSHNNSPLRRLSNSPPRRLQSSPPQRHVDSPPRRLATSPSKDDYNAFIPSKRADLSIRSKAGARLCPRVLLTDFRKNGNSKNLTRDNDVVGVRDNDGFLLPKPPMQRSKMQKFKYLMKDTKIIANNYVDAAPKANVYWVFKRIEIFLEDHFRKISTKNFDGGCALPHDKNSQVTSWLHSSTKNCFGGEMPLGSSASTILQDYAPSITGSVTAPLSVNGCPPTATKASYVLNNWTLIKGKEPAEIMLSGKLIDINSHEVIEENHVSSHVIAADSVIAQTACCVYILTGEFQDLDDSIPQDVKRYFVAGQFPKEWKNLIKLWSILRAKDERRLVDLTEVINRMPYEGEKKHLDDSRVRQTLYERDFIRGERALNAEKNLLNQLRDSENEKKFRELFEKLFREKEEEILRREERILRNERTMYNERRQRSDDGIRDDTSEVADELRTVNRDNNDGRLANISRYGRKRKATSRLENLVVGQQQKKLRIEPSRRATLNTPRNSGRLSFISQRTRSAARKQQVLQSLLCTPKSSKISKIRSRIQTPGPKRRRILQDDSLYDSDQM